MVFDIFGDAWVRFVSFDTVVWGLIGLCCATKFVPFVPSVPVLEQGLFYKIEFSEWRWGSVK
jgi:hypothetical protein